MVRVYKLTCDYCFRVVEQDTNKFPSGWQWSQIILNPVQHICPECLDEGKGKSADRHWKNGGQQKGKVMKSPNEISRGQQSLQPMKLTPRQAAELQSNLDAGTARPKIKIKGIHVQRAKATISRLWNSWCAPPGEETPLYWTPPTPSKDDPKCHEMGSHFQVWGFVGIIIVALLICYFTNTYPWINGVFKL